MSGRLVTGDCCAALDLARPGSIGTEIRGKVDLAYLDPPFNTGKDFGVFDDRRRPDVWLAMLEQCLRLTQDALRPTGVVFVHVPAASAHRVRVVLDDVFGPKQYLNQVVWVRGGKRASATRRLASAHDVIVVFGRSVEACLQLPAGARDEARVDSAYRHRDDRGRYRYDTLTSPGVRSGPAGAPWRGFDPTARGRHWSVPRHLDARTASGVDVQGRLEMLLAAGLVELPTHAGQPPRVKRHLDAARGPVMGDVWSDIPALHSRSRERVGFATQKPESLLRRIIELAAPPGGVVLDPFAGSGTTAAVAHKLGRSWIAIEVNPMIANGVIAPRLQRVIAGEDPHGITEEVGWAGGGSFVRAP